VNYAVKGQDGTGIKIAGAVVQPGFMIETDLKALQQTRIPVYAISEDLEERGIKTNDLIEGVRLLSKNELGKLVDQFDTVWNW
jgi:sulfur relay (sulfurtransferase) DsrF/TusC family protein